MIKFNKKVLLTVFTLTCVFGLTVLVKAVATLNLATADGYVILAGSTITNTGSSTINGKLGLFPGTSVTGFPPGIVNGVQEITTAAAAQAEVDLVSAYTTALSQPISSTIPTQLGSTTVIGGVYDSAAGTFDITGTLILDGQNDPNTVFIFKADSTLITAASSTVVLINSAQACNVFWIVGSSATLGSNSILKGTIMASSSVTLTTGAQIEGRALAIGAAVTLDTNVITSPTCIINVATTTVVQGSSFGSGPSGSNFGSGISIPWWALATTTPVQVVNSTTTQGEILNSTTTAIVPGFPNTGLGLEESLLLNIFIGIFSGLIIMFFLRKNKKIV